MKKRNLKRFMLMAVLLVTILGTGFQIEMQETEREDQKASTQNITNDMVIPGGMPIGIYMHTDGVFVLGTEAIVGLDGGEHEPAANLVNSGDYIIAINQIKVQSKSDLIREIRELSSDEVILKLRREQEEIEVKLHAVQGTDRQYKLGIWIRDSAQGLGTITFLTQNYEFGALGHGIHDSDTDELLEISEGRVYETRILRIEKGVKGTPGGMEGMIIYNRYNILGSIQENTESGIFGTIEKPESLTGKQEMVYVGNKNSVKSGPAVIRCCVEGKVKEYEIEIQKLHFFALDKNKGMVIHVVDEELLEVAGGIVQGMSGSPILQNGKLVGAVTHVLVNDPTRGYGIFIEEMMKQ